MIGPKWLGGSGKEARINEENVRIEAETALQQGLSIIPVLVSGATIPKATELPQSLEAICYLNGTEVDGGGDFHLHMNRVIQAIDQIVKASEAAPSRPNRKWSLLALGAIGCLILAAGGIWAYPYISDYIRSTATPVAPYIDQDFYYKLSASLVEAI